MGLCPRPLGQQAAAPGKDGNLAACERLIAAVLLPKYLPQITPTEFNYSVTIYGKWHGNKYRFITRYRSDQPVSFTPEFEAPFARLEYRFDGLFSRKSSVR